jgi:hypothetical protein
MVRAVLVQDVGSAGLPYKRREQATRCDRLRASRMSFGRACSPWPTRYGTISATKRGVLRKEQYPDTSCCMLSVAAACVRTQSGIHRPRPTPC